MSDADGAGGSARSLQHSYQLGSFSTNLLARQYSRGYATVGSPPSPDMVKYETSAGLGFSVPPAGSFSVNYSKNSTYAKVETEIVGLSYSRVLSRSTSLFVTASQTKTTETVSGLFVGLNFNFDQHRRGSVSYNKSGDSDTETLQVQKDIPVGEGVGYRATLARNAMDASSSSTFNPFIQYNARYGSYSLDSSFRQGDGGSSKAVTVTAAGALVYADGFYGFTRPVADSFGFVTVGDLADVAVLNNGQVIGKTDASGTAIVPTMSSYNQNRITIDTKNMSMDYTISGVNANISPSLWSGSCMAFNARRIQAVTGSVFIQQAGKRIPLEYIEITMSFNGKEVLFPTGKGGEFYLENALPEESLRHDREMLSCREIAEQRKTGGAIIKPGLYHALAEHDGRTCRFDIVFPVTEDVIWDMGEVICTVR
jgi:outer membrane usher protein FimD/PapC